MRTRWIAAVLIVVPAFPIFAGGQNSSPAAVPLACGVELSDLHVSARRYHPLSIQIKNMSGKRIVGLVFNAALSDATERWKWLHWNYDLTRPLQDIGWNKPVKERESKTLSWDYDLEREQARLKKRLDTLLLPIMRRHSVSMWIVTTEEFHPDTIAEYIAPPIPYVGRRDFFIFTDRGADKLFGP